MPLEVSRLYYIELLVLQWFILCAWSHATDVSISHIGSRPCPHLPRFVTQVAGASSATLCCGLVRSTNTHRHRQTHTHTHSLLWSHSPVWCPACQPQLAGRSLLGPARSPWHTLSWRGREAAAPCLQHARCQRWGGAARGVGSGLCCIAQTAWGFPASYGTDQMDPQLALLPPRPQGHRISDWGFVLLN